MKLKPENILSTTWSLYGTLGKDRNSFYDLTLSIIGWQVLLYDYLKQQKDTSATDYRAYTIDAVYHTLVQTGNDEPVVQALQYWDKVLLEQSRISGIFAAGLLTLDPALLRSIPNQLWIGLLQEWARYFAHTPKDMSALFIELLDHIEQKLTLDTRGAFFFYTPTELSQIMVNYISNHPEPLSIYDPFAGSGGFLAAALQKLSAVKQVRGYATTELASKLAILRLLCYTGSETMIELKRNTENLSQEPKQFDVIISNPPYGTRYQGTPPLSLHNKSFAALAEKSNRFDVLFLGHTLDVLSDQGRAAVLLPGIFISGNTLGKDVIAALLAQNVLDMVIELPPGLFTHTAIAPVLFGLSKTRTAEQPVVLIDATAQAQKRGKQPRLNHEVILQWMDLIKANDTAAIKEITTASQADIAAGGYDLYQLMHNQATTFPVSRKPSAALYRECMQLELDIAAARKKTEALMTINNNHP